MHPTAPIPPFSRCVTPFPTTQNKMGKATKRDYCDDETREDICNVGEVFFESVVRLVQIQGKKDQKEKTAIFGKFLSF